MHWRLKLSIFAATLTLLILGAGLAGCGGGGSDSAGTDGGLSGGPAEPPPTVEPPLTVEPPIPVEPLDVSDMNIIVVMTDDQRWDTLDVMPNVTRIADQGMRFENAYITTPLCAPARASVLSGGFYVHDAGVLTNEPANGNYANFSDASSLVQQLEAADEDLVTGYVGKYLNGYGQYLNSLVEGSGLGEFAAPAGWDYFYTDDYIGYPKSGYFNSQYFEVGDNLPAPGWRFGETRENLTKRQTRKAINFVERNADRRFFLFLSYRAPHIPATDNNQLPEDQAAFQDVLYRERAWGEEDLSDKSQPTQSIANDTYLGTRRADEVPPGMLRLLQPVDRGMGELLETLEAQGIAENTAILFFSDNGYHWGEHRLFGKATPYEESVRTPLIVYIPGLRGGVRESVVAANLDVPATVMEMVGMTATGSGNSLLPLVTAGDPAGDSQVFIENYSRGFGNAFIWSGVIRKSGDRYLKLVNFANGESEFYELGADPFELQNSYAENVDDPLLQSMQAELDAFKRIAILDRTLPFGKQAQPYEHQLSWWGAESTPEFELISGELPDGMVVTSDGRLTGVPAAAGTYFFQVRATGEQVSRVDGEPLAYTARLIVTINE